MAASRMLKKSASGVLASLRGSPYGLGKRLLRQATGGRVKTAYASPIRSLRPCWTAILSILRGYLMLSHTSGFAIASRDSMSLSAVCQCRQRWMILLKPI